MLDPANQFCSGRRERHVVAAHGADHGPGQRILDRHLNQLFLERAVFEKNAWHRGHPLRRGGHYRRQRQERLAEHADFRCTEPGGLEGFFDDGAWTA